MPCLTRRDAVLFQGPEPRTPRSLRNGMSTALAIHVSMADARAIPFRVKNRSAFPFGQRESRDGEKQIGPARSHRYDPFIQGFLLPSISSQSESTEESHRDHYRSRNIVMTVSRITHGTICVLYAASRRMLPVRKFDKPPATKAHRPMNGDRLTSLHGRVIDTNNLQRQQLLQVKLFACDAQIRNFARTRDRVLAAGGDANEAYNKIQAERGVLEAELRRLRPPPLR